MGRKLGSRGKGRVPVWLVTVAFVQLSLTVWFIRSLSSNSSSPQVQVQVKEDKHHKKTQQINVEPPPFKEERSAVVEIPALNETTLDPFLLFPKTKEIEESKATPSFDEPVSKDEKILFSIVIAAYNQGKYLQETVNSLLQQTYQGWELIIVDDGSQDETWDVANSILANNGERRIKIMKKENGGLSDARNYGMRFAKGNWLCMLDSDDLLGKEYLSKAASLASQGADIVVGCMENFDAVSSVWCFPEGWSIVGVSHWNKFHASVLMSTRLVKSIGGYDQSLLWGLEDWNFWLSASRHRPRVMHLPEITFYYRHHTGSSMRKEMFRIALEESKAMVRSNHPDLFEPYQLLEDHKTIGKMRPESLERLEKKMQKFPTLAKPHFWKGLYYKEQKNYEGAIIELQTACKLIEKNELPEEQVDWQPYFQLALAYEEIGNYASASQAIDKAFTRGYFDEILACKYRLQKLLSGEGLDTQSLPVTSLPSYWDAVRINKNAEVDKIREGTLAGKLKNIESLRKEQSTMIDTLHHAKSLLKHSADLHCNANAKRRVNYVANSHFEESGSSSWFSFEKGFQVVPAPAHPDGNDGMSLVLQNANEHEKSGGSQTVYLNQAAASPVLVMAWSRPESMSGSTDDGYSLYVDITYSDGSNDWGYTLPFNPNEHKWQHNYALLDRPKPITQLNVYCMLRGHQGKAYFDDVVVSPFQEFACTCVSGEMYMPTHTRNCVPCPKDRICAYGFPLAD